MKDFSVRFKTDLFDYRGPLPEEANAGNKFYGKDVAEFLSKSLASPSLDTEFLDEDWGWLVLGKSEDGKFLEIAIYNSPDEGSDGTTGTNEWGLWIRAFEKRKWLGIFSRSHEIELPPSIASRLDHVLREAGLQPSPWLRDERGS